MTITALIMLSITDATGQSHHYAQTEYSMEEAIIDFDAFYMPDEKDNNYGFTQKLSNIPRLMARHLSSEPGLDWSIMDDVVMDYWESRDDARYWTPLCVARYDLVHVGK